jgi:hypothetical protein
MDYLYYLQRVSTGECSDNSKAIKELDQDNISICTHMESLAEDLKAFKLERNEMKSTLLDLDIFLTEFLDFILNSCYSTRN